MQKPSVILSAFLDEGVPVEDRKDLEQQLLVGQAIGLKYWTPRFVLDDETGRNENIVQLSDAKVRELVRRSTDAGFQIGCIGTAVGKVKLEDVDDGNRAPYKSHGEHMEDLRRAIEVAHLTGAKFLRAFSFYPPLGADPEPYFERARDRLAEMADACRRAGLIYLMEPEPNLVGSNARRMLRLCDAIGNDHLLINPDAANMHVQGYDAFREYQAVAEAGMLGFMHIKDYTEPCSEAIVVDEEALRHFGSVDVGLAGHGRIFADLAQRLPAVDAQLRQLGAPGLILDVEGHMKGGGQFGGWSGPDGLGVAVRALTGLLEHSGIRYIIRQYPDIRKK
ncbi:MAG: sugar phosphate isomerase/epimerase [Kiritimatiellaeota bacterium]|nr:sugar phosphate isomerase/epimerase [Kiritimatiellota bacterium]